MPSTWHPDKTHTARWLSLPGLIALCLVSLAQAATNVSGAVRDAISGQALAGVEVRLSRGATALASGITGQDGTFQLFADLPVQVPPQVLGLTVSKEGYGADSQQVTISAGRANLFSYRFSLLRDEARDCTSTWARTVVVGHVRPPIGAAGELELSQRISEVLQYDLLSEVQRTHLSPGQQPVVIPCPKARPRTLLEHVDWARALKADAFLVGSAEPVDRRFRVDIQVSSQHGQPGRPQPASTAPLNLDRPESADLGRAALTPIMQALLRAYQKDNRYVECVEFAAAAQRALGMRPEIRQIDLDCRARLPNRGLLPDGDGQ